MLFLLPEIIQKTTVPNQPDHIDNNLISRFREGDMQAFDLIYHNYNKKLFAFVFKILKIQDDAKEIVQDVFIKLWENREKVTGVSLFNSYLFTIAYNTSIDLVRKRINEKKYVDYINSLQKNYSMDDTINKMNYDALNKEIGVLIEKLPLKQREVYKLSRNENLSYKEIAEKLKISVNTVENHISKALQFLRKSLKTNSLKGVLFIWLFM